MKKSDLYRKYADALDLCEKHGIDILQAVKYYGDTCNRCPVFTDKADTYSFPVAVVEGKPVFVGDVLFNIYGVANTIKEVTNQDIFAKNYTWEPPKPRTFMLNGVEFPAPSKINPEFGYAASLLGNTYYFKSLDECNRIRKALICLFDGGTQ